MNWRPLQDLKVTNAGIVVYPPGATFGPRKLDDFEFVWIIEGNATVQLDQIKFDAPAGTILLSRPGMTDRYDWATDQRTVHAFFHFDFKSPSRGRPPLRTWPLVRQMAADDILRPLFRYVLGLWSDSKQPASPIEPAVNLLVRAFVTGTTAVAAEPHYDFTPPVHKALQALGDALSHDPPLPVTLAALAEAAHVSREHLCRQFRRNLGVGPAEYVSLARLERAASLLARSNLSIKEVSDAAGFTSQFHFSKKFKKVYAIPPRDFRQSARAGIVVERNPLVRDLQLNVLKNRQ